MGPDGLRGQGESQQPCIAFAWAAIWARSPKQKVQGPTAVVRAAWVEPKMESTTLEKQPGFRPCLNQTGLKSSLFSKWVLLGLDVGSVPGLSKLSEGEVRREGAASMGHSSLQGTGLQSKMSPSASAAI